MKRILCAFLALWMMVGLIGCSKEPVAFSEKLRNDRLCYIDVVEIRPVLKATFAYCECVLEDGNTVWMQIIDSDYEKYFDPLAENESSYSCVYTGVKYDEPVRLSGVAKKTEDEITGGDEKIKVFRFREADAEKTLKYKEQIYITTEFKDSLRAGTYAYADIIGISFGIATNTGRVEWKCTLTDGTSLDVYADISTYREYFDANAKLTGSYILTETPEPIDFAQPVRIYGMAVDAKKSSETSGLMPDTEIAFAFYETVGDSVEKAKVENQPAVAFTDSLKAKQKTFVELVSIAPEYVVQSRYDISGYTERYVCRCITTDGKEVWICMTLLSFKEHFLNTFVETDWENVKVDLNGVKVNGVVENTAEVADDLPEKIGTEKVILFQSKG